MQIAAVGRRELVDMCRQALGKRANLNQRLSVCGLDKQRYLSEVDRLLLRECLHGIQHAIVPATALEDAQRHRPCGMHEELVVPTLCRLADHVLQRAVLHGNDVDISPLRQFLQRTAIDAHHLVARLSYRLNQVCRHPSSSYQRYLHLSILNFSISQYFSTCTFSHFSFSSFWGLRSSALCPMASMHRHARFSGMSSTP